MVNRRKETILILFVIIILLLIAAGISYNHYVEKHRKVVPKENYYSDFVVTGEKTVPEEDKKDDNNYQTTNQPTKKPKTEFEQVLEKYILGDSEYGQMGDWLPKLLNNKLTDENKTIIVLKNQDYVTKRKETELTCKELFPNTPIKEDGNHRIIEKDGKKNFCYDAHATYYDYNELNSDYKKLFGNNGNLSIINDLLVYNYGPGYQSYLYSNSVKGYVNLSCNCGGTYFIGDKQYRIFNSNKSNEKMVIDIMYFEFSNSNNIFSYNGISGNSYSFQSGSDIEKVNSILDEIYTKEKSFLKKYRFNFVKGDTDYYLESIEDLN